ncbi:DNA polymerase-like [Bidens hawaiensis]|uniref:DNA polymerase-like n=1 Tax=Bidens hawaiensis TaxID=980011 RepID=UPI00404A312E
MFKLEDRIKEGYFLAPKSYCYTTVEGKGILKYKGAAKNHITPEWFKSQYANPSRKEQVSVTNNFGRDWKTLTVHKKVLYQIGISMGTKRLAVFREDLWVDTEPIEIKDLSNITPQYSEIILSFLRNELNQYMVNSTILSERLTQMDSEMKSLVSMLFV